MTFSVGAARIDSGRAAAGFRGGNFRYGTPASTHFDLTRVDGLSSPPVRRQRVTEKEITGSRPITGASTQYRTHA